MLKRTRMETWNSKSKSIFIHFSSIWTRRLLKNQLKSQICIGIFQNSQNTGKWPQKIHKQSRQCVHAHSHAHFGLEDQVSLLGIAERHCGIHLNWLASSTGLAELVASRVSWILFLFRWNTRQWCHAPSQRLRWSYERSESIGENIQLQHWRHDDRQVWRDFEISVPSWR